MTDHDRGTSPIPGEDRLTLVVMAVMTGIAAVWTVVGLVVALAASAGWAVFWVGFLVLVIALLGLGWAVVTRREYLRKVRNGDVIVREPWSGADLLPPG
ncbi:MULTISPECIES: hypothetical protein [Cellulomonas]|uniref:UsfY protein n=2 Tax=Cellulomonas TaxID=1707 RepID=A0A401UV93_9CELL|nr:MULTISPECIES: hypothetical protein [Cellulomonas]NKY40922.1 hypothetical protein [Cellulomonas septica]GCD18605.1 hypothetical protein CTKZ_01670 [Cellulomonas algicola]